MTDVITPLLIPGDLVIDDRGGVGFVNGFDFKGVKRFYTVRNHQSGFVRAWHGHRRESKYVSVLDGAAVIGAVRIDNWEKPGRDCPMFRFVLCAEKPSVLYIPPGYANGFMSLAEATRLIFYSTSTLDESRSDDVRYNARLWDIWNVEER